MSCEYVGFCVSFCDGEEPGGVFATSSVGSRFRLVVVAFGISGLEVRVLFLGLPRRPDVR